MRIFVAFERNSQATWHAKPSNCHCCCCCWFAVVASVPLVHTHAHTHTQHTKAKISDFYTFLHDDCALYYALRQVTSCACECVEFPFNTNCRISPLRNWTRYVHCCNSNGTYNCFSYHAMPPVVGIVCHTYHFMGSSGCSLGGFALSLCRHKTISYTCILCMA